MTDATAMEVGSSDGPANETSASRNEMGAFFAAVAALQRETVLRFEGTVGRLTGLARNGVGATDRDRIAEVANASVSSTLHLGRATRQARATSPCDGTPTPVPRSSD